MRLGRRVEHFHVEDLVQFLAWGLVFLSMLSLSCTSGEPESPELSEHERVLSDTTELHPGYMTLFDNGIAIAIEPGALPEGVDSLDVNVRLFGTSEAEEMAEGTEWELAGVESLDRFVEVRLTPEAEAQFEEDEFVGVDTMTPTATAWIIMPVPAEVAPDDLNSVLLGYGELVSDDDRDIWDWLFEEPLYDSDYDLVAIRLPYIGGESFPTRLGLVEDRVEADVHYAERWPIIGEILDSRLRGDTESEDVWGAQVGELVTTEQKVTIMRDGVKWPCREQNCPFLIECWNHSNCRSSHPDYPPIMRAAERALPGAYRGYKSLAKNKGPRLSVKGGRYQYVLCSETSCRRCDDVRGKYYTHSKTATTCLDKAASSGDDHQGQAHSLQNPNLHQVRRTTAHELVHAFQFGYSGNAFTIPHAWISEATARYLEDIHPDWNGGMTLNMDADNVQPRLNVWLTGCTGLRAQVTGGCTNTLIYHMAHFWWYTLARNNLPYEEIGNLFERGLKTTDGRSFIRAYSSDDALHEAHWRWVLNAGFRGYIDPTGELNRCALDARSFRSAFHRLRVSAASDTASETITVVRLAAAAIEIELPSGGLGGKNRYYVIEVEDSDSRYDFGPNSNVALYTETAEEFRDGMCKSADGNDLSSSIRREKDFVPVEFSEDTFESDGEPRVTKFRGHVSVRGSSSSNHHSAYIILTNPTVTADPDSGSTSILARYKISVEPAKEHYNVDFATPSQTATHEVGNYFEGVLEISTPDFRDPPEDLEFALLVDGVEVDLDDTITLDVSDDSVDYRWSREFSRENLCPGSSSKDFDLEVVMTKPSSGDPSVRSRNDDGYETKSAPLTLSVDPSIGLSSEIEPANVTTLTRSEQFAGSLDETSAIRKSAARNSEYLFDASGDLNDGTPPTFDGLWVNGFAEHCDREWNDLRTGLKWYAVGDEGGTERGDSSEPWRLHVEPDDLRTQTGVFEAKRFVLKHDEFPSIRHYATVRPCVMATYVERQEMMVDGEYYPACEDPIWDVIDDMDCNWFAADCRPNTLSAFGTLIDDYIADKFFGNPIIADPVGGFPYQSPRDRLGMTPDPDVANPEEYSGRFLNYVDSLQTYSEETLSGSATSLDFLDEAYGQIRQLGPEATVLEHFAVAEFANIMGSLITLFEAPDAGGFNAWRSLGFVMGHHNPNRLFKEVSLQRPIRYAFNGFITAFDTYVGAHGNISAPYASNPAEYNLDEAAMLRVKQGAFAGFLLGVYEELAALE
jgi:hypothetical protein